MGTIAAIGMEVYWFLWDLPNDGKVGGGHNKFPSTAAAIPSNGVRGAKSNQKKVCVDRKRGQTRWIMLSKKIGFNRRMHE